MENHRSSSIRSRCCSHSISNADAPASPVQPNCNSNQGRKREGGFVVNFSKRRRTMGTPAYSRPIRADAKDVAATTNTAGTCGFINALSSISQFMMEVQQMAGAIELISQIMKMNVSSVNIQLSGLRALTECGPMAMNPRFYVDTITRAMKEHVHDTLVQIQGCRALRRWVRSDENVLLALGESQSNLSVVFDAMNQQSTSSEVRFLALDILRTLACFSSEHRVVIANQPYWTTTVLRLLENNMGDSWVQQIGLSLLSWIVEEKTTREVVIREGGILHVLRAMESHLDDQMVQCNSAATLCWLIHAGNPSTSAALAAHSKGIAIVLKTMNRYIDNPMVFGNCICVLSGALVADLEREDLANPAITRLAISGIKIHMTSPKVHRNCMTLLRILTSSNDSEVVQVVIENLDSVHKGMLSHPSDGGIQAEGCGVLANICSSAEARALMSRNGCIETVFKSQLRHKQSSRVQTAALLFHSCLVYENLDNGSVAAFGGGMHIFDSMISNNFLRNEQESA